MKLRHLIGFRPLELVGNARRSFRYHLAFALLDGASAGILSNAGLMAVKGLAAEDWQLGIRLPMSSFGMFAALILGSWMADRRKMPFVVVPGLAFAACSLIAALFVEPLWFLVAIGIGSAFEVAVRPGQTAIIRLTYPATLRGAAVGETRRWASLVFLISILASSFALRWSDEDTVAVIRLQMCVAGMLSLGSFLCFRKICFTETFLARLRETSFDLRSRLVSVSTPLTRNARFRRYTFSCFLFGFFNLAYVPYFEAVLVHDLGLGYVGSAVLLHVVPSILAFLTTGHFGHWIDRTSPWIAWGWIRFGWGLDPLILCVASAIAATTSSAGIALATIGRVCRGTTMGASWMLWWMVGINHFAPPGADTSRYMGIFTFMNGVLRFVSPLVGGALIYYFSRGDMLAIGGIGVLASAAHAFWAGAREKASPELATMADFESQFSKSDGKTGKTGTASEWRVR